MFNNNIGWYGCLMMTWPPFSHWILFSFVLFYLHYSILFFYFLPFHFCPGFLVTCAVYSRVPDFSIFTSLHESVTRVRTLMPPHALRPPHHCVWFPGTRHFVCVLWCVVDPVTCWSQTQLGPNFFNKLKLIHCQTCTFNHDLA